MREKGGKMMTKKISILLTAVFVGILCFSFSGIALAETAENSNLAIKNITEDWARANSVQYITTEEIPIVQSNGKSGYMVAFRNEQASMGYIIIYLSNDSKTSISQFTLDGEDLYNTLIERATELGYTVATQKVMYECEGIDYGIRVLVDGASYLYTTSDSLVDIPNGGIMTLDDSCISDNDFDGLQLNSMYSIPQYGSFELYSGTDFHHTNNCGPVAVVNMLTYWKNRGYTNISSPTTIYNYVVNHANFNENVGMTVAKMNAAAKAYVKSVGYSTDTFDYWWDWFSYFKSDLRNDYTILTTYQKNSYAHAVVAVGYKEYSYGKYLQIYTGYKVSHKPIAHLNFDAVDKIHGVKFKVK